MEPLQVTIKMAVVILESKALLKAFFYACNIITIERNSYGVVKPYIKKVVKI